MSDNVDIKEIIKQEYLRCSIDPVYFLKKYCHISHSQRGKILFQLYPFQEKVVNLFNKYDNHIILKSRQLGISTLVAGYTLWMMLFHPNKVALAICTKQATSKNMVEKVTFMWENLPSWMRGGYKEKNKLSLKLDNDSAIIATSGASDSARSYSSSILILDEAAFIDDIEQTFASAQQTLANGGKCFMLSTPNGVGNFFHKMWVKAENGENEFTPIKLKWDVHPERDYKWRQKQTEELGEKLAAQECFSEDVIIYTKYGPKFIKDIKVGDYVLSHNGSYNKVTKTFSHESSDIFSLKSNLNHNEKFVTSNHPFLTINNEWKTVKELYENAEPIQLFPKVQINSKINRIDLSQYLQANSPKLFPIKVNKDSLWITKKHICNRFIEFDYDLGFIIGAYMSEGSTWNNVTAFSYNHELERNTWILDLEKRLRDKFNIEILTHYVSKSNKGASLYVKSQIFKKFIELCFSGHKNCQYKHFSKFIYENINEEFLKGMIDGIMIGDGMLKTEHNCRISLSSQILLYDLAYSCKLNNIHNFSMRKGYNDIISFLNTKNNINSKYFSDKNINSNSSGKKNKIIEKDGLYYTYLKLQPQITKKTVYNFEVENTHTYVTEYGVVHNCDTEFLSSGQAVIDQSLLNFYEQTYVTAPMEKRGIRGNFWVWEYPDFTKTYMVVADVARGDGKDYSGFHVIDIENNMQVAEFKDQIPTDEFGNLLYSVGTEYNDALVIVENSNIGWATLQVLVNRGYRNLYYSSRGENGANAESYLAKQFDMNDGNMIPGFTNSLRSRPLIIDSLYTSLRHKLFTFKSSRLLEELRVFVWRNGKAEAQSGYNDDLVIAAATGQYLREGSLRFKQMGLDLSRAVLGGINMTSVPSLGAYSGNAHNNAQNQWNMNIHGRQENLNWLI